MSHSEDAVELFYAIAVRAGIKNNMDNTLEQKLRELLTLQNAKSHRPVIYTTAKARTNMAAQIKELKTKTTQRNKKQQKLQPIFNKLRPAKTVNLSFPSRKMSNDVCLGKDELPYNSPTFPDVYNFKKENGQFVTKATKNGSTKNKFKKKTFGNSVITKDEEVQILDHLVSLLLKTKNGSKEMERKILGNLRARKTSNLPKASNEVEQENKNVKIHPRSHYKDAAKKLRANSESRDVVQEPFGRSEVVGYTIHTKPKDAAKKNINAVPKILVEDYMHYNNKLKTIPPPPPTRDVSLRDVYVRYGYQTSHAHEIAQNIEFKLPQIDGKESSRMTSFFQESPRSQNEEIFLCERRNRRTREMRENDDNSENYQAGSEILTSFYPEHHLSSGKDLSKSKAKRVVYTPLCHKKKVSHNKINGYDYPRFTNKNDFDELNVPSRAFPKKRQQLLSPPLRGFTPYPELDCDDMSTFGMENDNI